MAADMLRTCSTFAVFQQLWDIITLKVGKAGGNLVSTTRKGVMVTVNIP